MISHVPGGASYQLQEQFVPSNENLQHNTKRTMKYIFQNMLA